MEGRLRGTFITLVLLGMLSEGPVSKEQILDRLEDLGLRRNERQLRRYLAVLDEAGFEIQRTGGRYVLLGSPVRLPLDDYEALATLNVLESLGEREPVYGKHLSSAAKKVRDALPSEVLGFVDRGRIEFDLTSASDPPEDPLIIDTLRQAVFRHQRLEIHYHSLRSGTLRWRTVEPLRVSHAQKAHRLYAYEQEENRVTEFRINRITKARMLPDKFSPEAHVKSFEPVKVRLSKNAFVAYGKSIIPDHTATIEPLEDGGAIVKGTTPSTFWTVREISALGPDAEVLGSPRLREEFISFLEETMDGYE